MHLKSTFGAYAPEKYIWSTCGGKASENIHTQTMSDMSTAAICEKHCRRGCLADTCSKLNVGGYNISCEGDEQHKKLDKKH